MKGKFPASRGSIFLLTLVACLVRPAYHQSPNYWLIRNTAYGNDIGHCGGGSAIELRIMIAFLSLHGNGVCCVTDLIVDFMVMVMAAFFFGYIYIYRVCELAAL